MSDKAPAISSIEVFVPFTFTNAVDPRALVTVGDQVVSEHVFAFHSRESIKDGFCPVFSRVILNPGERTLTIEPVRTVMSSDGTPFDFAAVCKGLEASLRGTRHAPYGSLIQSVACDEGFPRMTVRMRALPVNLKEVFTLPDFSIHDSSDLPMTPLRKSSATGPYSIVSMTKELVELKANPHYPKDLRANSVESVRLHSYPAAETVRIVREMGPKDVHLAYFYGYALSEAELQAIRAKGYSLETFPAEWLIYLAFGGRVSPAERKRVAAFIDANREKWVAPEGLGQPAYSISPSNRPFGLTSAEYSRAVGGSVGGSLPRSLELGTFRSWYGTPLFRRACDDLTREFPNLQLKLHDNFADLAKSDLILSPLGISQFDPLTHLAFLSETMPSFAELVSGPDVAEASVLADSDSFFAKVKGFELRNLKRRALVPLAHFPGVVAHAPGFVRDDSLAFSWGIQAWAFRVR